ncbi:transglutaminase domain-containing protein [Phytoactinopolyspora alkaliphila]|uniref:Transglutaminase domain-containing protein n=1 Tax=Phytoactinopolyspora alkaliphila TaxID=1783498 RepID=A0A6N9YSV1_9ACTN|nr:transglutaminase-like domain-containing protein [Phytoactinopolyspora alkaliphila]NED98035.1 transglutaminase domain-containing protein [Phytoactinopolyspora alkaliphila]
MRYAWAALVLLAASLPLARAYDGWVILPALLVAVLLPLALVAAGRWLKLPAWLVATAVSGLCTAAALGVLRTAEQGLPLIDMPAWRDSPGLSVLGPLIDSVPRLLTGPRPAPGDAEMLTPVMLLVALISLTVYLLAGRCPGPGVSPVMGAAVLYVCAALLTAGEADRHGVAALVVVVLSGAGWVLLDRPENQSRSDRAATRRTPGRRAAMLSGVAGLAVVGSVTLVAAALPSSEPFEPRELVTPPVVSIEATNPLPMLSLWGEESDLELFRVRGTAPDRLALVVLPEYDGAGWSADAQFQPMGAVRAPDLPPGRHRGAYDVVVDVVDLPGLWLPAAGTPTGSSLADVYVDVDTGSLVRPAGTPAGLQYAIRGEVDQGSAGLLRSAGVPADAPERYLAVPGLPREFATYAAEATVNARSRFEQAQALETLVRTDRSLDPLAPVGSSYARLREFLFGDDAPGAQSGTSEQFATAFIVMARSLGIPSRLVVGFDVPRAGDGDAATVYGKHANAWPEVYLSGAGWVAFDPTPSDREVGDGDRTTLVGEDELVDEDDPGEDDEASEPVAEPPGGDEVPDESRSGLAWPAAITVVIGVLLTAVVVLFVLRVQRRLRHRRAGAVGAWDEALDAMWLAGVRAPVSRAAPDLAGDLARLGGGDGAAGLAAVAEREAFGPPVTTAGSGRGSVRGGPDVQGGGSRSPAGDRLPHWKVATALARGVRRGSAWPRRLLWWIDPRVLRR